MRKQAPPAMCYLCQLIDIILTALLLEHHSGQQTDVFANDKDLYKSMCALEGDTHVSTMHVSMIKGKFPKF